ncbi:MAG: hypothetical protein DRJ03_07910 [Chloroflexi bacterium]|nr:MAG: hypothetical protein DRI81_03135 [Chloroflexota bacterium]RLC86734.1 MAG: hypothetical protein DRJ03_07910 [Chloroflexota bacterium]
MAQNLLKNGGFEADWGDKKSHRCLVFPASGGPQEKIIGNIFTPSEWTTWFLHDPGTWDQPEVRDAWKEHDARRVHGGKKGMLLFTFYRGHDAGFFQRVQVAPGTKLRLTAWAHAWSNHLSKEDGGRPDDGRWSDGAGYKEVAWKAGTIPSDTGDPQEDAKSNFTFYVGIDPTGGDNPLADTVVWGQGYHIYNGYCQELAVETTSQTSTVTVFLRSKTMWKFKHSDAYWDDAELVATNQGTLPPTPPTPPTPPVDPAKTRGQPRVQYDRTYVLLAPDANKAWALAAVDGSWQHRYTIGGSADDSGIGDLNVRRVIAVNPARWPTDLHAFFKEYYAGVEYIPVEANTPAELERKLKAL